MGGILENGQICDSCSDINLASTPCPAPKVTYFQLEKLYGTSKEAQEFLKELCKGQAGTPHPQAWCLDLSAAA